MDAPYPRHNLRPRNVAAAERRRQRAYDRAIADLEMREADLLALRHPADKPRRTHWSVALINIVSAIIIVVVVWLLLGPYITASLVPAAAPAVPTMRPVAPPAAAPAAESGSQAPALPVEGNADAPAQPITSGAGGDARMPTAVINIPAPASAVTLDPAAPLRYAPGSGPAQPAPTVVTTAFMVAGEDFSHNDSQTCVETTRDSDGARVRFCQQEIMTAGAMSSVADYLRTGMIVGEVVSDD